MEENTSTLYRARADGWVLALLAASGVLVIAVAILMLLVPAGGKDPSGLYIATGAMLLLGAWTLAIPYLLRYELREDSLRIYLFPLRVTLPYRSIVAVHSDGKLRWAAVNFALSVRYVVIEYDGFFGLGRFMPVAISPERTDQFLAELRARWHQAAEAAPDRL